MGIATWFREAKAIGHAEFRILRVRKVFGKYKFTLLKNNERAKLTMNKAAAHHFFPHIDKVENLKGNSIILGLVAHKELQVKKEHAQEEKKAA